MALRTDAYYRNLVDEWLRKVGVTEPPVPMAELPGRLGIPVRQLGFPSWFSGAVIAEDGLPVILLNAASPEHTRRRTLGHLLAHFLIVLDDPENGFPRHDQTGQRRADLMAEEFLLPEYLVRDQAGKWFNDHRYLARLFGVQEPEMLEKLRELGVIKSRGSIFWDY